MRIKNKWYVIIREDEVDSCQDRAELLTYLSIKSYCANGKRQKDLSIREIAKRSKYAISWTPAAIERLKKSGLVFTNGTVTRIGGTVEVFSVGTGSQPSSVPLTGESVPSVTLSVPVVSTNPPQSNKVKKEEKTHSYKKTGKVDIQLTDELKESIWSTLEATSEKEVLRNGS